MELLEISITEEQLDTIINSLEKASYKGNNITCLELLNELYAIRDENNEI